MSVGRCRWRFAFGVIAALAIAGPVAGVEEAGRVDFGRDVLPILSDQCFQCHGPDAKARKADLRLDTREGALGGGSPVIVPGKSVESEFIARIVSDDPDEVMPPSKSKRKLTPAQIETLRRWVDQGAHWGKHWSYEPPRRPPLPSLKNPAWPVNAIDAFILARLEREGLAPSAEASRETLIRRASLDLTGLPPTLAEVDAFLADTRPDAYERVVDRLLASPRYGERMAWDWLDAARYADSNGYQGDQERTMWPWRDWVVSALNANMPYDQFTVEQIAGDLLPNATLEQKLATAFNRNHMINGEGGRIPEENRIDYVMDQTETTATIWLGLTFTCARCHNHKYDPFTQRDYYGLFAYFNQTPVTGGGGSGQTSPVLDFATKEQSARRAQLSKQFDALAKEIREKEAKLREAGMVEKDGKYSTTLPQIVESTLRKGPNDRARQNTEELKKYYKDQEPDYLSQLDALEKLRGERDALVKGIPRVMVMEDLPKPRETFILTRGAYDKPADKVEPGVPEELLALASEAPKNRLALARWLVDPNHPLTARVTVNRAWQLFFGTGLVKSVEDFGVQGELPSHPELLDWLATEFVASGWDVKALHRQIVLSGTYRQASKVSPGLLERDPENRLLARGPRHRLPSWLMRDQALAIGGLLSPRIGGAPARPYQPEGIWEEATFGNISYRQDHGEGLYRRSLYTFWRRIVGPTMFFDTASRQTCTVKQVRTNTPLHALTTLNDVSYVESARSLAEQVLHNDGATMDERLADAFRRATARRASEEERQILRRAHERLKAMYTADPRAAEALLKVGESPRDTRLDPIEHAAMTGVCTLILNLDETLTNQ